MKFRMFTLKESGRKVAVNVDHVQHIRAIPDDIGGGTEICFVAMLDDALGPGDAQSNGFSVTILVVAENFDIVFSRLNTIAE